MSGADRGQVLTGLASWAPGAGVGDALIANANQAAGPVTTTPRLVLPARFVADESGIEAQAQALAERSSRWRWLRAELRQFIDNEAPRAHRWARLMVDDTGSASGNAADLAFRYLEIGSTEPTRRPHFVIGNGSRSADGRIESTGRSLADDALRIVLIGDLHVAPPTAAQLHGLTELIDYLRAKVGVIPVRKDRVPSGSESAALPQQVLDLAFNQAWVSLAAPLTRAAAE